jgi:hypothetical protein
VCILIRRTFGCVGEVGLYDWGLVRAGEVGGMEFRIVERGMVYCLGRGKGRADTEKVGIGRHLRNTPTRPQASGACMYTGAVVGSEYPRVHQATAGAWMGGWRTAMGTWTAAAARCIS